jgi:hypothetical protein
MPTKYFTKVKKCITKHCNEISKKLSSEIKLYRKKLNSKCKNTKISKNSKKNNDKKQFSKCAVKFYKTPENKEYRNTFTQYEKCNKNKCLKEFKELHKKI